MRKSLAKILISSAILVQAGTADARASREQHLFDLLYPGDLARCDAGCRARKLEEFRNFISDHRLDINATNGSHETALNVAVRASKDEAYFVELTRALLNHPGIDSNHRSDQGPVRPPLLQAIADGNLATTALLLAHPGIDVNGDSSGDRGVTPIVAAAVACDQPQAPEIFKKLLAHPALDLNNRRAVSYDGETPLQIVAEKGCVEHVELLLADWRTDVNAVEPEFSSSGQYLRTTADRALLCRVDEAARLIRDAQTRIDHRPIPSCGSLKPGEAAVGTVCTTAPGAIFELIARNSRGYEIPDPQSGGHFVAQETHEAWLDRAAARLWLVRTQPTLPDTSAPNSELCSRQVTRNFSVPLTEPNFRAPDETEIGSAQEHGLSELLPFFARTGANVCVGSIAP